MKRRHLLHAGLAGAVAPLLPRLRGAEPAPILLGPNADLGGRLLLPPEDEWNRDISNDPVDPRSEAIIASIGADTRLHEDFDPAPFSGPALVILEGLRRHGMILADNGGDWFVSGAPDDRWIHEELLPLRKVKGRDLEVVRMDGLVAG